MTALDIPEPKALAARSRLEALEHQVLTALPAVTEPNDLIEPQRRAAALETYLRGRDGQEIAQGIAREIEIRIGELLGEPLEHGGDRRSPAAVSSSHANLIPSVRHVEFWELAKAVAADLLGPKPRRKSRRALLEVADRAKRRPAPDGDLILHHCSCVELAGRLEPGTVDVIVTDPPYGRDHLDCWVELAEAAPKLLRPGGLLWALSGHAWLPDVLDRLSDSTLTWHWMGAYLTPGNKAQVWARRISTAWKPVLVYSNGPYDGPWVGDDTFRSDRQTENQEHPDGWQQSTSGIDRLVARVAQPGDVVCDPFVGTGTVAYAAAARGCAFVGCDIDTDLVSRLT